MSKILLSSTSVVAVDVIIAIVLLLLRNVCNWKWKKLIKWQTLPIWNLQRQQHHQHRRRQENKKWMNKSVTGHFQIYIHTFSVLLANNNHLSLVWYTNIKILYVLRAKRQSDIGNEPTKNNESLVKSFHLKK